MTTATVPERPRAIVTSRVLTGASAVVVAAAAVLSGMSAGGTDKKLVVVPLALVAAALLAIVACTRFSAFVMFVLGVRASIDLFKISGPSAGNTLTNTTASRGLDPSSILGVLFLLAATLWLIAQYYRVGHLKGSRLRLALVAFGTSGVVGLPGSSNPLASGLESLRIFSVVMMYVVLEQLITDRQMMKRVITTAYVSMLFPLAYTLYGFLLGHPATEAKGGFTRITGPFSQSNTYARYLAFMIIFGVAVFPYLSRRLKVVMAGTLSLSTIFLMLTLTRGALIAAVLGVLIIAVIQRQKAVLLGFVVAAIIAVFAIPGLGSRFTDLGTTQAVGGAPTGNTLAWRLDYWTAVLPLANSNPVTGIGLNMTQYMTDVAKQPHNDFIRAYVETGVLGLVAYVAMLAALVGNARRALRRALPGTLERGVAAGALGCAIAYILESGAANVMSNVVSLWYLIAFAAAASFVARAPSPEHPQIPALDPSVLTGSEQR